MPNQEPSRKCISEKCGLAQIPKGLAAKMRESIRLYPCDVLLVHRDAEKESRETRIEEIATAIRHCSIPTPYVCVVPVRMQEAWMLFDENAIRLAAGNPNGHVKLNLPKARDIEHIPDPKVVLHGLLKAASELTGRRLKKFSALAHVHRVTQLIEDWSPLRTLSAFVAFEKELDLALASLG